MHFLGDALVTIDGLVELYGRGRGRDDGVSARLNFVYQSENS